MEGEEKNAEEDRELLTTPHAKVLCQSNTSAKGEDAELQIPLVLIRTAY